MEWERVLDHAGQRGAFVRETNTQPFRNMVARLFPGERALVESLFPHHKVHLRLATDTSGRCIFSSSDGCQLPREARPYYCRLFPLWIYGERLTAFTADGCLAVREGRTVRGVMQRIAVTESEVRSLFGRLRLAWGLDPGPGFPGAQAGT
jgi:Fe-S-cluster containining protein